MLPDRCLSCLCVLSVTLVYCGQTVGWIEMPLDVEVGFSQGRIVLDGDPALSQKNGHNPQFSAHVCCGQTAGRIEMPLGRKVGLRPSGIVLDGDPAVPQKRGTAGPTFRPMSVVAKQLDGSRCHLVRRSASAQERGTAAPTFRPMSIVAKRSPISPTAELLLYL